MSPVSSSPTARRVCFVPLSNSHSSESAERIGPSSSHRTGRPFQSSPRAAAISLSMRASSSASVAGEVACQRLHLGPPPPQAALALNAATTSRSSLNAAASLVERTGHVRREAKQNAPRRAAKLDEAPSVIQHPNAGKQAFEFGCAFPIAELVASRTVNIIDAMQVKRTDSDFGEASARFMAQLTQSARAPDGAIRR